jgi:hypothetical protein
MKNPSETETQDISRKDILALILALYARVLPLTLTGFLLLAVVLWLLSKFWLS